MELRPYQKIAVQTGIDYFHGKSDKPSIIVAPTAYGKSVVISAIANELEGKTVVLQPSKELLQQNYSKLQLLGGRASIYSASMNQKEYGKITYATIGSIKKLGGSFRQKGYTNVIVDECHLYPPSSDSMFGTFINDLQTNKVLGLTATPFRLQTGNDFGGNPFSKLVMLTSRAKKAGFFKEIIHVHQIQEIVKQGFWSKLEYEAWDFDTGELKYNSAGSDFSEGSMNEAYKNQSIGQRIAGRVASLDRKSILIFVPSVQAAHDLSRIIPNSAVVWGDMPDDQRDQTIRDFKLGRIRVAINVNVLSVGFDHPDIDCVIIGRPTASLSWFYQATGRGTRLSDKKEDCLIIDFVGNTDRFGRVENLTIERYKQGWQVFSGDIQLTSVSIREIGTVRKEPEIPTSTGGVFVWPFGKHKGTPINKIENGYLKWCIENFDWNDRNQTLKNKILSELKSRNLNDVEKIKA